MAVVDFSEVETPERFEFFARDFLRTLGFEVLEGPDRGPEEGRDLLVREPGAITGRGTVWLVSCKHQAQSGRAVGVADERDPSGRVSGRADGFLGFYSTPPTAGLTRTLERLRQQFKYYIYDPALIEHFIVARGDMLNLLKQYFPRSYRDLCAKTQSTRLRVSTEAGYSFYAKDITFELDSALTHDGQTLTISDAELEASVTACHLAKQLRAGRYEVIHGIVSFNPTVWRLLVMLLRINPLKDRDLAVAIRSSNDTLQLRLLVGLAGELECADVCTEICQTVLFDGRRHDAFLRELGVQVRPFLEVARWTLGRLPVNTKPILMKYAAEAKQHKRWTERKVFETALRRQAGDGGAARLTSR